MRIMLFAVAVMASLLFGPLAATSRGEAMFGESLQWLVADSDLVVRATVADFPPIAPGSLYGDVTLAVTETFKGEAPPRLTFNARMDGVADVLQRLKIDESHVFAFMKGSELRQVIVPAGEAGGAIIHNWSFWRGALMIDGGVLWETNDIAAAIRDAVNHDAAARDAGLPAPEVAQIEPFGAPAWSVLYGGSVVHLAVPVDDRLKELAQRWVAEDQGFLREEGRRLLELFEQEQAPCDAAIHVDERTSLVVNGGFEKRAAGEPPNHIEPLAPGATDLVGWEVIAGSVDWIGPTRWRAAAGQHCLDIDAPGAIRQVLETVPGQDYVLAFDVAGNPEIEPAAKQLIVDVAGQRHFFEVDATGHTPDRMGWTRRQLVFRAAEPRTTLAFTNASDAPTASGVALDNVTVDPIEAQATAASSPSADGRFRLATAGERIVLLDSATGETWILSAGEHGPLWRPIPRSGQTNDP